MKRILYLLFLVFSVNAYTKTVQTPNENQWKIKAVNVNSRYYINYIVNGKKVKSFKVDKLPGIEPVQTLRLLGTKRYKGIYYILFEYSHPSVANPGPRGYCGGGYEDFVALLRLDKYLKISRFENYQIGSCINSIEEGRYTYDPKRPEHGIKLSKK